MAMSLGSYTHWNWVVPLQSEEKLRQLAMQAGAVHDDESANTMTNKKKKKNVVVVMVQEKKKNVVIPVMMSNEYMHDVVGSCRRRQDCAMST